MIRGLIGALEASVERRFRNVVLCGVAAATVALLAAVSLGFGTFAAYAYIRASQGSVVAAVILCAAYGLLAITILATWMVRRHASRSRRTGAAPASPENINSFLQSLAAAETSKDRLALVAAMQFGRELSPMQMLALALIAGVIAGRKLGK